MADVAPHGREQHTDVWLVLAANRSVIVSASPGRGSDPSTRCFLQQSNPKPYTQEFQRRLAHEVGRSGSLDS